MSRVQIHLSKGETLHEAEQDLLKALHLHASGDVHSQDEFQDPVMERLCDKLKTEHQIIYSDMLNEINEVLDKTDGYR